MHSTPAAPSFTPFAALLAETADGRAPLRAAIGAAGRRDEQAAVQALLAQGAAPDARAHALARELVAAVRQTRTAAFGVDALMHAFSLSSEEGVALLCLAEALLRIPDRETADRLIADKISKGDWRKHLGATPSPFVNAATWGLFITGKLVGATSDTGLGAAMTKLIGKGGEPLIRKGVDLAMRMLGSQFVTGRSIAEALGNSAANERRGYRYSYDMLGEAALTEADANKYFAAYAQAIDAVGAASSGRGIKDGPGISVKLSALYPRYSRAQHAGVMSVLLPRLRSLVVLAKQYNIGINIDAEEADRLDISLDLFVALACDLELARFDGIGIAVQAYQKRCPAVIDFLVDLARRSGRKWMIRLVKGAYWDAEIKRAQVDGLPDYPVYTRKVYTDVSYLTCARQLLAASDVIYPQFATHNAHSLAVIATWASDAGVRDYEFQCLHGMGESLYDHVVGKAQLDQPCRIYAPVGSHDTLLSYLVRRLLENGANSSFVNQIVDENVAIDRLLDDPFEAARRYGGLPHPGIALPHALFGAERKNSAGIDLADEDVLRDMGKALAVPRSWVAEPVTDGTAGALGKSQVLAQQAAAPQDPAPGEVAAVASGPTILVPQALAPQAVAYRAVVNPAQATDIVGRVRDAAPDDVEAALERARAYAMDWQTIEPSERADLLCRVADLFETHRLELMALAIREAGKSLPNAVAEVREAVDFLRYYAAQVRGSANALALGPVACISPWNFPLAIFTGQVAAALAAGNVVLAKPAEQTPLIAHRAVQLFHEAGIARGALQFLPGPGEIVGAALCNDARVKGVIFTGSTEVAQLINRQLARRAVREAFDIALIAETGGQNAMIVDSSALPEQVVHDVIASAFDSAGQRCSALRVLFLQEDIADKTIAMLKGAMQQLRVDNPDRLSTDIGPVIDAQARQTLLAHIDAMKATARDCFSLDLAPSPNGLFVAPTLLEIGALSELTHEVFGPVLHIIRYRRARMAEVVDAINATGYGLTLGIHSRINETVDFICARARVGNIYVNRNIIGAVVGVQPFGGEGKSGTGPKAGGPLYLKRLQRGAAPMPQHEAHAVPALDALLAWAEAHGHGRVAALAQQYLRTTLAGTTLHLPGPTGERNTLSFVPRGVVLCAASTVKALLNQLAAVLATGNHAIVVARSDDLIPDDLPLAVKKQIEFVGNIDACERQFQIALVESALVNNLRPVLAGREGALIGVVDTSEEDAIALWRLVAEHALCVNTTASGGNASLMTLAQQ